MVDDGKQKCLYFLGCLLKLSKREPQPVERTVHAQVQDLIDEKIEPKLFCDGLEKLLRVSHNPGLVLFLKKYLPPLRESLFRKELELEGIHPPLMPGQDDEAGESSGPVKRAKRMEDTNVGRALKELRNIAEKVMPQKEDEIDCFGKSIVCQLRKLPEPIALESIAYIQNYLVQQRLNALETKSPCDESGMSGHLQ